jgi:glucan 1,3-beta-glucosidase
MVGTDLGGWLVIEPWITPSLFYRFLDKTQEEGSGWDMWTLCETLGPEEGNRVLRAHWDNWVTEDLIKDLVDRDVEILRLPIGDWTLKQYGPYEGCTDGAKDYVHWLLKTAEDYNLKVLLDIHGVKDSQNGYESSGQAERVIWTDDTHFTTASDAEWMGHWNGSSYDYINLDNINWAIDTVYWLLHEYGTYSSFHSLSPVNEPWTNSDKDTLKNFYRKVREVMRDYNHDLVFVFGDFSSQLDADYWNDLFEDDDMENVVMDTHLYLAFGGMMDTASEYCDFLVNNLMAPRADIKYPVWVGEWSLATETCATWLLGFNSESPENCQRVDCPAADNYLPADVAVDFDRTAATVGPYRNSDLSIKYGQCQTDSTRFTDADVQTMATCWLNALNDQF